MTPFLITIIVLALIFDYINGFHDAANSIATVVSTKVLTPFQAVLWAALFNSVAFFIFKDHGVADTVAKTVKPDLVQGHMMIVIFSGYEIGQLATATEYVRGPGTAVRQARWVPRCSTRCARPRRSRRTRR